MRCQCRSRLAGLYPQISGELTAPLELFPCPEQQVTVITVLSCKATVVKMLLMCAVHPLQLAQDISCASIMIKGMQWCKSPNHVGHVFHLLLGNDAGD